MMGRLYTPKAAWLEALPDLHRRLQTDPPARIADIGCAAGWSSISVAQSYSNVRIDGFDIDGAAIDLAWRNAHDWGLTDRVTFHVRDVSEPTLNGRYDLSIVHQGWQTLRHPDGVLATMRRLAGEQGTAIIADYQLPIIDNGREQEGLALASIRHYAQAVGFVAVEQLLLKRFSMTIYRLLLK